MFFELDRKQLEKMKKEIRIYYGSDLYSFPLNDVGILLAIKVLENKVMEKDWEGKGKNLTLFRGLSEYNFPLNEEGIISAIKTLKVGF